MARRLSKRANKRVFRHGYNRVVAKNIRGLSMMRGGSRL